MPLVNAPPVSPAQISDVERFAKAYFGIELTSAQLNFIRDVIKGMRVTVSGKSKRKFNAGLGPAEKVLKAYIAEGVKPDGRARLPLVTLPAHLGRTKTTAKTQSGRILELIKRPGGAFNFELSRIALKYDSRIFELRRDGHAIVCDRQYLKNGRASNTFLYRIAGT